MTIESNPRKGVRYIEALERTVPRKTKLSHLGGCRRCCVKCGGSLGWFQLWLVIFTVIWTNSTVILIQGMGFLTRNPNSYECLNDKTGAWESCSKDEICTKGLDNDHYRAVQDDEYLDNWESPEKLNTLCEPSYKIGLFGSLYFAGICSTVLIIPWLSDKYCGRIWILIGSLIVQLIA